MKKSILILTTILCFVMLFVSCGKTESTEATYKITVKDALGSPYTAGVMVRILKDGEQVGMQVVNEAGVVSKTMEKAEYSVELVFTNQDETYYYDTTNLNLSAEKITLDIILSKVPAEGTTTLYVQDNAYKAYTVEAGCTYVTLTAGKRNYFLFTPVMEGTYEVSVPGSSAVIGYYGAPHFVQDFSAAEVTDNQFTISVNASMIGTGNTGTSIYVIGIDAGETDEDCILAINRTGNAQKNVSDEPWFVYSASTVPSAYTLAAGATIAEFDLTATTATYPLVLNSNDGFYHLQSENGPLVLVRLATDSEYIASYKTILETVGVNKYFYDADGNFEKKESYSECLLEYINCADENNGVYPLTEDLKYIMQQNGDYLGWWDPSSSTYLFKDENGVNVPGINTEIGWLAMCCYIAGQQKGFL